MPEIKLYTSKWKNLGLFLGCSVFVSAGFHFILSWDSDTFKIVMGWISILFFGLGIPMSLFNILDWRPQIIINELGILDRTVTKEFINWNAIESVYLLDTGVKFISITLKPGVDLAHAQSRFSRRVSSVNKSFGYGEVNINLGSIKIDEERLAQFIVEMSRANPEERTQLLLNWN